MWHKYYHELKIKYNLCVSDWSKCNSKYGIVSDENEVKIKMFDKSICHAHSLS